MTALQSAAFARRGHRHLWSRPSGGRQSAIRPTAIRPTAIRPSWRKRRALRILAAALLLAGLLPALAGCGDAKADSTPAGNGGKLAKVRFGGDSSLFSLQFRVAKDQGFFKKNGIDAELFTFSFGIDTLNAVLTDRVDVGEAMDYAALSALSKGNLRILALISSPRETSSKLFVRDGITGPEDLVGKKVGVQKGTVNEYIWGKYFETFHLDPSSVKLVPLQSTAEILAAYDRGDIKAAWFGTAYFDKALKVEGSRPLGDLSAIGVRTKGFLVSSASLVEDRPELSAGIARALKEASDYIVAHPEESAELAFKELKIPKEPALRELKNEWEFDIRYSKADQEQLEAIQAWSVAGGYLKQDFRLEDKLALDGLKEAFPDKVEE